MHAILEDEIGEHVLCVEDLRRTDTSRCRCGRVAQRHLIGKEENKKDKFDDDVIPLENVHQIFSELFHRGMERSIERVRPVPGGIQWISGVLLVVRVGRWIVEEDRVKEADGEQVQFDEMDLIVLRQLLKFGQLLDERDETHGGGVQRNTE